MKISIQEKMSILPPLLVDSSFKLKNFEEFFKDKNLLSISLGIKPDILNLLQEYSKYPKQSHNVKERFLAVYRILESYYSIVLSMYKGIFEGDHKGLFNQFSSSSTQEFEKLKLLLSSFSEIFIFFKENSISTYSEYNFNENLALPNLDIKDEKKFFLSLSNRIYDLRNSVVHADDKIVYKGVHKSHLTILSYDDIQILDNEIQLLEMIAFFIISISLKDLNIRVKELFINGYRVGIKHD
jgi:hypothetical protein